MPDRTSYMAAADKAHSHLLRGFNLAWNRAGRAPLGTSVLDPRTIARRDITNIAANLAGETAGLPMQSRAVFQQPKKINKINAEGQTEKNKKAGIVVDPTALEMHTGTEQTSIDTVGGYGLIGMSPALTGNSGGAG